MSVPDRRSQRLSKKSQRIDYRVFNDTGEKKYKYDVNFGKYTRKPVEVINTTSDSDTDNTVESICNLPSVNTCSTISNEYEDNQNLLIDEVTNLVSACHLPFYKDKMDKEKEIKMLELKLLSLQADIDDHLEENIIDGSFNVVEDIDMCITKVEKLRTEYRKIGKEMESMVVARGETDDTYDLNYKSVLGRIKDYVLLAMDRRSTIRQNEASPRYHETVIKEKTEEITSFQKARTVDFLLNEVTRLIVELENEFSKPQDDVTDEELMRRNRELPENMLKLERLSKKFQHVLEVIPDSYPNNQYVVKSTTDSYNHLIKEKGMYESFLKHEIQKREILKENSFNTSFLNIKL